MSSSEPPGSRSSSSAAAACVEPWAPVPKAAPGSITMASASASGSHHGGPTQKRPTRTGWWNARQASRQPGSTGDALSDQPAAGSAGATPAGR